LEAQAMNIEEAIRELRGLNEPVPQPMRLPSEGEVSRAEGQLGVTFHPDYRKYLLQASDVVYGTKEPCTVMPDGGHTDLTIVAQEAWGKMGVPRSLVPICEDNGDYYCMNEAGEVVFWSHNGMTGEQWPNLGTWIKRVWIEGQ
jgi:hypothetical protein